MDTLLFKLLKKEIERQRLTLNLIPSENIADPEMLQLLGSPLVNKYSEGYPGKRYYPGNVYYDKIEELAKSRALEAFKLKPQSWAVNIQAYSGSPANYAIYFALANVGDTIMGLSLAQGGHLTHGHKVNFSGTLYKSIQYGLDEKTNRIDYDALARLARKHKPKIIFSGATAYPRKFDFKKIGIIAKKVNAYHVADISHIAGLIAAQVHPSPFPYADAVTGTLHKTLRGPRGAVIFANKNSSVAKKKKIDIALLIDRAIFPGLQGGPHNNTTAAAAWAFKEASTQSFKRYQKQVVENANVLARELKRYDFTLVSGGTDNHLLLVVLKNKGIEGKEAEELFESAGIIANRNSVPGDLKPFRPSGIRLGTPALTSRGMKTKEMILIAEFMHVLIDEKASPQKIKKDVEKLARKFPLAYRG